MAGNIKSALAEHIANCEWMCDSTKTKALNKLDKTKLKIGYSEEYVDYKDFTMCDTFATNVLTCLARYFEYEMSFINSEISDDLWYNILPHTVNMYYVYNQNEIIVPAAMLQPPYFYANGDDAVNYGAIGASIGHELTHGFDTQGQMFDQFGNLNDWWSDNDKTEFYRRAQKLVDRFNSFIVVDSMHADGDLTLCENVADLGGLLVAYTAFSKTEQWKDQTKLIDGLTPDQRFLSLLRNHGQVAIAMRLSDRGQKPTITRCTVSALKVHCLILMLLKKLLAQKLATNTICQIL